MIFIMFYVLRSTFLFCYSLFSNDLQTCDNFVTNFISSKSFKTFFWKMEGRNLYILYRSKKLSSYLDLGQNVPLELVKAMRLVSAMSLTTAKDFDIVLGLVSGVGPMRAIYLV